MPPSRPPLDTSPDAHAIQLDVYRTLGSRGRVAAAFRLTTATREWTKAGIRARHPDYSPEQVTLALARLTLGDDLVRRAWPDRPLVDP